MEIEIICPKAIEPVKGTILNGGTKKFEVWEAKEGLSGKETKGWKTIVVKCSFCNENHEYALTMHPK